MKTSLSCLLNTLADTIPLKVSRPHGVHPGSRFSKRAPKGQNGAPGDCGSFAGVRRALLCFVVLWGRFATDIRELGC